MVAANGLILLSQGELSLKPANKTGSDFYISSAIQVRSFVLHVVAFDMRD